MRKTILFFTFFICFMFMANTSQAQNFKKAIGARLGYPMAISYKHFLNESNAIEVYGGTRGFGGGLLGGYRWYSLAGAYQVHKPIESVEGLDYYFGGGASVYFWAFDFDTSESTTTLGLQGYLGLSYTFKDTPINVSVDWVPTYFLNGFGSGFGADSGHIAVRYVLGGGDN